MQEMIKLAEQEALNLRKYTTPEERALLDIHTFRGSQYDGCIYGQMTGHCFSPRAAELIKKCCNKVYKSKLMGGMPYAEDAILNGAPEGARAAAFAEYWSPIEVLVGGGEDNQTYFAKQIMDIINNKQETIKPF